MQDSFMTKALLGKKVLPCQAPDCDIQTNKRYRCPAGAGYVACCYQHAERAALLTLARQRKALALAAA
jgi:hypothetical protein